MQGLIPRPFQHQLEQHLPARLAITLGDPRGIGPEIVCKALGAPALAGRARYTVVGPTGAGCPVDETVGAWTRGDTTAAAGALAGRAIEQAVAMAKAGRVDAIVTAPIDKAALLAGGFNYPGHTEMLGALCGVNTAMMLASDRLRVVLATTHIPLREVLGQLTPAVIRDAVATTRAGLTHWFGLSEPRVALCALNPHAGDGGRFGTEDDTLLAPLAKLLGVAGPFPADTVFVRAMRGEFDVVIAPYHDVGMTAIKVASFGHAVNITLGLPFPRTSPDHGTALDIAGQGVADASSMIAAIGVAIDMVERASQR